MFYYASDKFYYISHKFYYEEGKAQQYYLDVIVEGECGDFSKSDLAWQGCRKESRIAW